MALKPRTARHVTTAKREPDPRRHLKHREFVASLPCVACGVVGRSNAAHLRSRLLPGTGVKSHDRFVTPLCTDAPGREGCHSRQGRIGETAFWNDLGVDPWRLSERLWLVTGDHDQAVRAVYRVRQEIERARGRAR